MCERCSFGIMINLRNVKAIYKVRNYEMLFNNLRYKMVLESPVVGCMKDFPYDCSPIKQPNPVITRLGANFYIRGTDPIETHSMIQFTIINKLKTRQ